MVWTVLGGHHGQVGHHEQVGHHGQLHQVLYLDLLGCPYQG